jgi:hypothetical protein
MKTSSSSLGDNGVLYKGERCGADFYSNTGRIGATQSPGQCSWNTQGADTGNTEANFVHWGTTTWTQRTMDFIVPQYITSDGGGAYPAGQQVVATTIVFWMQACGPTDNGQAWFANPILQINP